MGSLQNESGPKRLPGEIGELEPEYSDSSNPKIELQKTLIE